MRILLAELIKRKASRLLPILKRDGYVVDSVSSGRDLCLAITAFPYSLLVLDLSLKHDGGLDLLSRSRRLNHAVPIVTFSEDGSAADVVRALDAGSDFHLAVPFEAEELIARCRALIRRSQGRSRNEIRHGDMHIDTVRRSVIRAGVPVAVSSREWAVLLQLMSNRGIPQSVESLEEGVYGWKQEVESNSIQVHISNLRKKLGSETIKTVRSVGYVIPAA